MLGSPCRTVLMGAQQVLSGPCRMGLFIPWSGCIASRALRRMQGHVDGLRLQEGPLASCLGSLWKRPLGVYLLQLLVGCAQTQVSSPPTLRRLDTGNRARGSAAATGSQP